jgi:hypothetical protein
MMDYSFSCFVKASGAFSGLKQDTGFERPDRKNKKAGPFLILPFHFVDMDKVISFFSGLLPIRPGQGQEVAWWWVREPEVAVT